MSSKIFARVTGALFFLIALMHILRLVFGWNARIGALTLPLWASAVATVLALYLAYHGLKLGSSR